MVREENVVLQQLKDRGVHVASMQEARPWRTGIVVTSDHILVSTHADSTGGRGLLLALSTSLPRDRRW